MAFSPTGRFIASGSRDKTVKVWMLETGQAELTLTGHTEEVNSVAFSPDGSFLASGSCDRTVKVWELKTARTVHTLRGHTYEVNSICVASQSVYSSSCLKLPHFHRPVTTARSNDSTVW